MPCRGPREVTVKQSAGKPVGAGPGHMEGVVLLAERIASIGGLKAGERAVLPIFQ